MKSMEAGSAYTGRLPKGCLQCRRGSKMVLLITGRCSTGCFYCPLSLEKKGKEVLFANERRCTSDDEVLDEARMIRAEGTGITGGDPVQCIERTLHFIRLLKKEFGERHHIHLYTSSLDVQAFRRLEEAGLDELRLHPPVEMWDRLDETDLEEFLRSTSMKVGFEIPSLPEEEERTERLIDFAESVGMDFVNLNELEFSEGNWDELKARGWTSGTSCQVPFVEARRSRFAISRSREISRSTIAHPASRTPYSCAGGSSAVHGGRRGRPTS